MAVMSGGGGGGGKAARSAISWGLRRGSGGVGAGVGEGVGEAIGEAVGGGGKWRIWSYTWE